MRLRLRVLRNELPAVLTLWPVTDTQLKHTVSQLLGAVNGVFPLEGDTWGLEDYTVTVSGYECLHYHELGTVCKDEDEVVIRPLQYAEVRARTLLGRDQITEDGRHLVDGLPFGRPLLRGVVRPEVRIPPRKKRRLELEEVPHAEQDVDEAALMRFEDLDEELDEEESEEDDDFEMEEDEEPKASSAESSSESSSDEDSSEDDSRSVTTSTSDSDSDADESMSEASWDSIGSEPPTPPGRKAASKTELDSRTNREGAHPQSSTKPKASEHSGSEQSHDATQSSLKRKAPPGPSIEQQDEQSAKKVKVDTKPGDGRPETQVRNARRRDCNKLKHLKKVGMLPPEADIATLHKWQESNKARGNLPRTTGAEKAPSKGSIAELLVDADEAAPAVEKDTSTETLGRSPDAEDETPELTTDDRILLAQSKSNPEVARIEEQRQRLLGAIASGGIEVTTKKDRKRTASELEEDEAPEELSTKKPVINAPVLEEQTAEPAAPADTRAGASTNAKPATKATDMVPSSVARRSKLDLAGSKRLLFGSLGVRVPKTQEERDALQKRLSDRAKQRAAPPGLNPSTHSTGKHDEAVTAQDGELAEEEDPEAWREKLQLTAVECCEEGVTLSTPPFPFYQRWDPQQRRKKARNGMTYMASKKGGGKHKAANDPHVEYYDKYNQNGEGDALNYDDPVDDDEYWEEGALLNDEYDMEGDEDAAARQLHEAAEQELDDGFPTLPADNSTLPLLAEADARKDDFVVYKELTCSAATNWQPSMLTRTAQLQGREDDGWTVKLAMRDLCAKEYDEEGKRVYRKFEMEGMSDNEEEDESVKTVTWSELIEARLLERNG